MISPTSPRDESVVEFTLRAAVAGIGFGILFGAANAYIGLRVGLTVATSIPIAVLTVALFRLMRRRPDRLREVGLQDRAESEQSHPWPAGRERR
jgi:uncharacterized oligopeptide transporter (OPT) family protein